MGLGAILEWDDLVQLARDHQQELATSRGRAIALGASLAGAALPAADRVYAT